MVSATLWMLNALDMLPPGTPEQEAEGDRLWVEAIALRGILERDAQREDG
jgi:hypothetical protein